MAGDDLIVDVNGTHSAHHKESCSGSVWCASRLSLDVIRDVLRPSVRDQDIGLKNLERLRATGASVLVSVHGRFIRGDCTTLGQRLGYFCHERSTLDAAAEERFVNHYCRYGLAESMVRQVKTSFARPDWPKQKLGFFLSTDSFQTNLDHTYANASLWPAGVHAAIKPEGTTMPADMWASVHADYYMSTPLSSCEGIIAQWRNVLRPNGTAGMFPRDCYDSYAQPQRESGFCDHTNIVLLDDPPPAMPVCERILALGSAIVKAGNGGVLLWGPWRRLVEGQLSVEHLRRAFPHVEFALNTLMRTHSNYDRTPNNWYSMRLYSTKEALAAKGQALAAVARGLWPNDATVARVAAAALDPAGLGAGAAPLGEYCHRGAVGKQDVPAQRANAAFNASAVDQVWAGVLAERLELDGSGACHQVAALWRAALNKSTEPEACFGGYRRLA